ncbi:LTA synthase family protein [Dokdonella soli]|uniref:Sulfatase N-terminal domain-containing protein n=1 Tax=Dokdonella soli TaxID=529810 RepID=A0ABN1IWC5_9GAMM
MEGIGMNAAGKWLRRGLAWMLGAGTLAMALTRLLSAETDDPERMFCLAIALALALILVVASGRIGFGLLVAGALAGIVWLAGSLELTYLHQPLLVSDLRYFTGASTAEVIAHYPTLWHKYAMDAIGGLLLGFVAWRLESPGWWRGRTLRARGGALLLALLPLLLITWPQGPFQSVHAVTPWEFVSQANRNPTTAFLRSLTRMRVHMPAYAPDAAADFDWGTASTAQAPARRPDLVTVLEESTLDPRQWSICNVPRCTVPLFDPDGNTHAHGLLKVHTYGGATWTSEFAFLTGLPHTLFGPAGVYAPFNLAPHMRETLPRRLKALGYRTIAIYPMPRNFMRAGDAYAEYGFDEFYDSQDLGLVWESTDSDLMRRFVDVLRRERAKDDRPLFFMVLTMRQHGPHDLPLDDLPAPWNQPPLPGFDARINRNLGHYLFRLHQSSDAIAELRRDLFADGRPTVLAHFGDHHPAFDGLEAKLPNTLPAELQPEAYALTYYRIDSNLDRTPFTSHSPLDLAFLAGLMLDIADLPKNAYFEANARLREHCGGRFDDCPNRPLLDSYLARTFGELRVFEK